MPSTDLFDDCSCRSADHNYAYDVVSDPQDAGYPQRPVGVGAVLGDGGE